MKLVGTDGSLASVPEWVYPRWPIAVTVNEADENRRLTLLDTVRVQVTNGTQSEMLTLTETGLSTGVFTGSIATAFSLSPVSGDGVVQAVRGDTMRFAYTDSLDTAGNTVLRTDVTAVRGGHDATLRPTWVVQPGDTTRVRVVDADLSGTVAVAVGNPRSGEQETVVLSQFAPTDSAFYGRSFTVGERRLAGAGQSDHPV